MTVGKHAILDLYGCDSSDLENVEIIQKTLKEAAVLAKATIISSHFHSFGEGMGITGVVILAESHISIHTWNEHQYAAVDVFMCGNASVEAACDHIIKTFFPSSHSLNILSRG